MFLSITITQKWKILSCDTLVANERFIADITGPSSKARDPILTF